AGVPHAPVEDASDITVEWGSLRQSPGAEGPFPSPDLGGRLKELAAEEKALAKEAGQIGWRCLANHLADESLVYRRRSAPMAARKDQAAAMEQDGTGTGATLSASGVSKDGAFGYTLGTVTLKEGPGRSFFRIWQKGAKGWQVLCDLQLPLPEEKRP
ncbi:MAG TPA: hypothetical protein VJ483_06435, partial [Holophagaceae bacterium]|nr:hypothetical protein [Holophagaceae bacterium]